MVRHLPPAHAVNDREGRSVRRSLLYAAKTSMFDWTSLPNEAITWTLNDRQRRLPAQVCQVFLPAS